MGNGKHRISLLVKGAEDGALAGGNGEGRGRTERVFLERCEKNPLLF